MRDFGEAPPPLTLFERLKEGLSRSTAGLSDSVTGIFTNRKLDAASIAELEEALIRADLGAAQADTIVRAIARDRFDASISDYDLKRLLAAEIGKILKSVEKPLAVEKTKSPFVILVAGVNGTGKTTTIGKLGKRFARQRLKVMFAAGDTFRAAAIEQLRIWGERIGAEVISGAAGGDAAGLAYDALEKARAEKADVLLVDTAGRLQNKAGLMAELEKIIRVIKKVDPTAPHAVLLVLDATTGQNAIAQVEAFKNTAALTGLIMTKLDGTAKGGILVALAAKFGLPVHFIGVGEGEDDLPDQLRRHDISAKSADRRLMNPQLRRLALDLGPLFVFFVAYRFLGIYGATGVFMGAVLIALALDYIIERKLSPVPIMTAVLVVILGGLTLYLQNAIFIKMKPTALYTLFGLTLLGGLYFNRLFLKYLLSLGFEMPDASWRTLTLRYGIFFLVLAVVNEIVWRNFPKPSGSTSKSGA